MCPPALRRLKARVLTAALLIASSGASVLDLALYHFGGTGVESATHRIAGTDAPRPHGDTCVLVDWTARGPYSVAPGRLPPRIVAPETDRSWPVRPDGPRPVDLSAALHPRAPPVHLA